MKEITKIMIKKYALLQLKYDFMGFSFDKEKQLNFHHLIIPRRYGGKATESNGAILRRDTSHDYLHLIEHYDLDMYYAITSEMIDENIKGYLDLENIEAIDDVLTCFEREYTGKRNRKGNELIKPEYIEQRILRKDFDRTIIL